MRNEELIEALVMAVNGPFYPVPKTSRFTLQELREVRWARATDSEKALCRQSAQSVITTLRDLGPSEEMARLGSCTIFTEMLTSLLGDPR